MQLIQHRYCGYDRGFKPFDFSVVVFNDDATAPWRPGDQVVSLNRFDKRGIIVAAWREEWRSFAIVYVTVLWNDAPS